MNKKYKVHMEYIVNEFYVVEATDKDAAVEYVETSGDVDPEEAPNYKGHIEWRLKDVKVIEDTKKG